MANSQRWLEQGLEKHRRGDLGAAETLYRRVLADQPRQVDALYLLGKLKFQCQDLDEAISLLSRSVTADPKYGLAHLALALAYEQRGKSREALAHFLKAHELDPRSAQPLYNLANAHASLDDNRMAEKRYREALALDPKFAAAHNNLGTLFQREGRWSEALDCFRKAVAADPHCVAAYGNHGFLLKKLDRGAEAVSVLRQGIAQNPRSADALTNLTRLLRDLGDVEEAEKAARMAVEIEPNSFTAHNELGKTLQLAGRPEEAEIQYREALRINPQVAETWNNLGTAVVQQHKAGDSLECYRRATEIDPKYSGAWSNLGNAHLDRDDLEESARCFQSVARIAKNPSLWSFRAETLCPTLLDTNEQIDQFRDRIFQVLERYRHSGLRGGMPELLESACQPSFNFPFHGRNDRPLKEAFAKVFAPLFPFESPLSSGGLPHVGVLITHDEWAFRRSVGAIFDRMDSRKLRITVVCTPGGIEKLRAFFTNPHIGFLPMATEIDKTIETMRSAKFDLIYHWEVSTTATSYFLPYCRLAPLQVTSWGIQVTSGIPAIDYYIGSDLAEPSDAEAHYSERLVRMRTMMSCQPRLPMPETSEPRESFGLEQNDHVYLCPQQFGKFHPDFDPFLRGILERDPRGKLVLIEGKHAVLREKLLRRFRLTLGEAVERVHIVPRLQGERYSSLFRAADVLLDPYHFGGVNTTYDAISLGKAVVTLPSNLHRGRYTLGCYRQMGYLECVANSLDDYVAKAKNIACEEDYRREVEKSIWESGAGLFDRADSAEELESFLLHAIAEGARVGGKTDWQPHPSNLANASTTSIQEPATFIEEHKQSLEGPFAVCFSRPPIQPARRLALKSRT
ncbi:MAG: tetratricopeptide repeat protein [Planctomycetota bacterium]